MNSSNRTFFFSVLVIIDCVFLEFHYSFPHWCDNFWEWHEAQYFFISLTFFFFFRFPCGIPHKILSTHFQFHLLYFHHSFGRKEEFTWIFFFCVHFYFFRDPWPSCDLSSRVCLRTDKLFTLKYDRMWRFFFFFFFSVCL